MSLKAEAIGIESGATVPALVAPGWLFSDPLWDEIPRIDKNYQLPSGKRLHNYGKIHHF